MATILASVVGSLAMGLIANYPIGLAPGMGLNAFSLIPFVRSGEFLGKRRWLVFSFLA